MPDFLNETAHRPYPLPDRAWVMRQTWSDLLFAHWPIPSGVMRRALPPQLTLDTFDDQAWIGVVPFAMSHVYPRYTIPLPWLSYFLEMNVRTYVTMGGKPGVYFFSLDAQNPLAVALARRFFKLPYFTARMKLRRERDGWIKYTSRRTHRGSPAAELRVRYRPMGEVYRSIRGSLDYWLTERYCLYTVDGDGTVYRAEIHHAQWPLQRAEAEFELNTMTAPPDIPLPTLPPLLHFARRIDMVNWSLQPVAREAL